MKTTTAKRRMRAWATLYGHAPRLRWQVTYAEGGVGGVRILDASCPRCGRNGQAWQTVAPHRNAEAISVDPLSLAWGCSQ